MLAGEIKHCDLHIRFHLLYRLKWNNQYFQVYPYYSYLRTLQPKDITKSRLIQNLHTQASNSDFLIISIFPFTSFTLFHFNPLRHSRYPRKRERTRLVCIGPLQWPLVSWSPPPQQPTHFLTVNTKHLWDSTNKDYMALPRYISGSYFRKTSTEGAVDDRMMNWK